MRLYDHSLIFAIANMNGGHVLDGVELTDKRSKSNATHLAALGTTGEAVA